MRLHLLDGTYELFRAYFGAPPRTAPDGMEVGATHGVLASVLNLLDEGVTHLGAAFDTMVRSFRNELYGPYKTESGVPEALMAQFPLVEEGMEALGVTVWRMTEYEADDAIASAVHRWCDDVDQVVILSPDKDMAQCITGDRVVAYDRRKATFIDEQGVWDKFGVAPRSIPDYLGLVGDSSDGFPGVPGWGAKSASLMLATYPHIEDIPLEASRWEPPVRGAERLASSLREHLADALLFRYLAQLRTDVPLTETLGDLEWRGVPRQPFEAFCDRWGFGAIRERPSRWVD